MSSSSIDQSTAAADASGSSGVGIVAVVAVTVLSSSLHFLASRYGVPVDSVWFATVGAAFLAVTVAAHYAASWGDATASESFGAVGSVLISMAIRLSGTFVILGLLLWFSPLERREAVFNVLFWYITLTATDVVALVRQRRRMENASAVGRSRVPGAGVSERPRLPVAIGELGEKLEK